MSGLEKKIEPQLMGAFLTSVLESVLNSALFHDKYIHAIRSRLSGKVLCVQLDKCPFSWFFLFSANHIDVFSDWSGVADCTITARFNALLSLMQDRKKLFLLIRESQLAVEGDIQILQHSVGLLDLVEWDIAEYLSPYCGDLIAQTGKQLVCKIHDCLVSHLKQEKRALSEAITEEWQLIPPSLAVESFKKEVHAIKFEVEALNARISEMEKQP